MNLHATRRQAKVSETEAAHAAEERIRDLQSEISMVLSELAGLAPMLAGLTNVRQGARLGFLDYAGKEMQAYQHFQEQAAFLAARKTGQPFGAGSIETAGNFDGISANVELWAALRHQGQALVRHLATRGVCTLHRLPQQPTTRVLIHHVRNLVFDVHVRVVLEATLRDLEHARGRAEQVIDGNDKAEIEDPCPHCGRNTLVIHFDQDITRCERDRATGKYEPCKCDIETCQCRRHPVTHRHEWSRLLGDAPNGWHGLAKTLARNRFQKEASTT